MRSSVLQGLPVMGTGSDHLFDLVSDMAAVIGAPAPIRFNEGLFEARHIKQGGGGSVRSGRVTFV